MIEEDLKQACLDLSAFALALFDTLDKEGANAPLENTAALATLKGVVDNAYKLRDHYFMKSTLGLLALGVSPEELVRMRNRAR